MVVTEKPESLFCVTPNPRRPASRGRAGLGWTLELPAADRRFHKDTGHSGIAFPARCPQHQPRGWNLRPRLSELSLLPAQM